MNNFLNSFQKKSEDFIIQCLEKGKYCVKNKRYENSIGECTLFIEVNNMEICIMPNILEFSRSCLLRSFEWYEGIDEEREIKNFTQSLVYYLENPEYKDEPSIRNLKGTYIWFMGKVFGVVFSPDIPNKNKLFKN